MINMLVYSSEVHELKLIQNITKEQVAYLTEDKWEIELCQKLPEVDSYLTNVPLLDVVCFDITKAGGIEAVEAIREHNSKAYIILIASPNISPVNYIRPTIMAAGLLLRPIHTDIYQDTIRQVIIRFEEETQGDEELFLVEDQTGKKRIPYHTIMWFEAREKKIYVCTESVEYGFYESLDKLSEELPDYFVRCHRGFIVNTRKLLKVALSENLLYLEHDLSVPISRSYKSIFKEYR